MEHKIDRISELPEHVVEHILSFIPMRKILQLSILSKRWQNVWALLPITKFSQYIPEFDPYKYSKKLGNISDKEKEQKIQRKKDDFSYFMERSLRSRYREGLSINMFKLEMLYSESDSALLNRCIGYAIKSNVKEFDIELDEVEPECFYDQLPKSVLTAKSITKLSLDSFKLDSIFYSDINLPSLKKLSFDGVCVDDQVIQALIDGCPVVEDISFQCCYGLKSIHVSGLLKLMALELMLNPDLERVEVQASNLQSLHIYDDYQLCQINLAPSENLNRLLLHSTTITDKWLDDFLLKHPRMEILDLIFCNVLERVYILSPHMKTLNLSRCEKLDEVNINTPNLHTFGYFGGGDISFSFNTMALSEANLSFLGGTPWSVEKISFLTKLSHPKLLTWRTELVESLIIPKELRESQPSPLYNVKKLELKAFSSPKRNKMSELLDALLWISPLLDILLIEWEDKNMSIHSIFFKFLYETPIYKGENPDCCKQLAYPCRRHCLKTVKIEDAGRFADKKELEKYFSENAKNMKSFQYS